MDNNKIFQEKLERVETAIRMEEPDRVPFVPSVTLYPYVNAGTTYKDSFYHYEEAKSAILKFYQDYPMVDASSHFPLCSGRTNELTKITTIDWPGRPGTSVPDQSTYQAIEHEFLQEDEYPEFLGDFSKFMLQKYIPRVFPAFKEFANIDLFPVAVLDSSLMASFYTPGMLQAYETLKQIAEAELEVAQHNGEIYTKTAQMGFPPYVTGQGIAPFDLLSNYFRGTMGALMDQIQNEDEILQACEMLADKEIEKFSYLKDADMPVKRVFFPMHKGMDGFMSSEQYETVYWKPFRKLLLALIDMGVTPLLCCEGKYNSRLHHLTDLPKGKAILRFEDVDMKRAKEIVGSNCCISGNLPIYLLEYGTTEEVVSYTKELIDICAPGGGYIFDAGGSIDLAKPENFDAMANTVLTYGSK